MSNKQQLRKQRTGTILNKTSRLQEVKLQSSLNIVIQYIKDKFPGIKVVLETKLLLKDIVNKLSKIYPNEKFHYHFDSSYMKPDGGFLYLISNDNKKYPILIAEKKNQGTNDIRLKEGKKKQCKGNAIERGAKNVIGCQTWLGDETIFPFICFGDGCDFAPGSTILDRVSTMNGFGTLNEIHVHNEGIFKRGSFFFREKHWTSEEMAEKMIEIVEKSIYYYFSKYKEESFMLIKKEEDIKIIIKNI